VVVSGKFHVPAALFCEKEPPLTFEKRVVCSRAGLEAVEKKIYRGHIENRTTINRLHIP
jgi:hypothetical protein